MGNKICMFCGHRDIVCIDDIREKAKAIIIDLIENYNVNIFYSGGMGDFDRICEGIVKNIKMVNKNIKLYLIIPYLTQSIIEDKKGYSKEYDEIIEPDVGKVHYKGSIVKRNRWMVENSDFIVSYVVREYGGAFDTYRYGVRKGKAIYDVTLK